MSQRLLIVPGVIVEHPAGTPVLRQPGLASTLNARLPKHDLHVTRVKCPDCGSHHAIALPSDVRMRGDLPGACPACGRVTVLTAKRVA